MVLSAVIREFEEQDIPYYIIHTKCEDSYEMDLDLF